MRRFLIVLLAPMLLSVVLPAEPAKDCAAQLASCSQANHCEKTPESKACKACKGNFDKCSAAAEVTRAKTRKTKFPY